MRWPSGKCTVKPPSVPGSNKFFSRRLPKVPRVITRSLPRRAPKELKSCGCTLFSIKYRPAGLSAWMAPAGEMWSVVTESPSQSSTRAPRISDGSEACGGKSWKKGGS